MLHGKLIEDFPFSGISNGCAQNNKLLYFAYSAKSEISIERLDQNNEIVDGINYHLKC